MMRRTMTMVAVLLCAACGDPASSPNNVDPGNNVDNNNSSAPACGDLAAGGDFCESSSDCTPVECQCSTGVVSTRSCSNGVCGGPEVCASTCADSGGEDLCEDFNSTANNMANNNTSANNTSTNNSAPMCDNDLSAFADYRFTYDVACLEANCCEAAAYCSTFLSCKAYDDCLYDCFSDGQADQACIRNCKDTQATDEFLSDAYAPFSTCAINNGC